jgi:hypothetical protein
MKLVPRARLVLALFAVGVPVAGAAPGAAPVAGSWRLLPPAPIRADEALTSAWTGKELVVFGRRSDLEHPRIVKGVPRYHTNVAAAYDPAANRWRRLAPSPVADAVGDATALWTGRRVVVVTPFRTLLYDPVANTWRTILHGHGGLAVWTGRSVLTWGGGCCGDANADGATFSPATGRWRPLPRGPLAGSQRPVGAWDGKELLVLVGDRGPLGPPWPAHLARAAAYDPHTGGWRRIAAPPAFHDGAQAIWTGHDLLLVGGYATATRPVAADAYAYDPVTDRWRTLPEMEQGRVLAAAAWTGVRLLLWGGLTGAVDPPHVPQRGVAYDPVRRAWAPLPAAPLQGRAGPTGVWTGRSFLVFGGSIGVCGPDGVHGCHANTFVDGAAFTPRAR